MIRAPRVFSLVFSAFAALAGCSNQAEGERCDTANGDADCGGGLVCTSAELLGGTADVCCPTEGSDEPACIPGALAGSASSTSATAGSVTGVTSATGTTTSATGTGGAATTTATGTGGTGGMGTGGASTGVLDGGVGAGLVGSGG